MKTLAPLVLLGGIGILVLSPIAQASPECETHSGDSVVVNIGWDDPIGGLAIRGAPNRQAPIKTVIPAAGTGIAVGSCQASGWCEVRFDCIEGWSLAGKYLAPHSERLYHVTNVSPNDPEGLNIRSGPGGTYPRTGSIPFNAVGVILHECQADGRWCLVTYGEDSGWAARQLLAPMSAKASNSGVNESSPARFLPPTGGSATVALVSDGGTFKVPVTINDQLTLKFVVDSGASDVSIPADVVATLLRTETITDADFLDKQTYRLADGSTIPSQRFVIRTLKIGDKTLENVVGSIAPVTGSLLLGQSFLSRFKSWSMDNQGRRLILN
jgi:clan AA aspartic protease (TIGR02281 family)